MLRTMIFALMIAAPELAAAEDFPRSVVGSEVHGDDGAVIGHVTGVQRDRHGNIVAVEIPGAEPPDAATLQVVARADDGRALRALRVLIDNGRLQQRADAGASTDRARLR